MDAYWKPSTATRGNNSPWRDWPHTCHEGATTHMVRFDAADGVWRAAFAFDPLRQAVILVAGDKSGGSEKRFYRTLIAAADTRLDEHLVQLKKGI